MFANSARVWIASLSVFEIITGTHPPLLFPLCLLMESSYSQGVAVLLREGWQEPYQTGEMTVIE